MTFFSSKRRLFTLKQGISLVFATVFVVALFVPFFKGNAQSTTNGLTASSQLSADGQTVIFNITGTPASGTDVNFSVHYTADAQYNYTDGKTVQLGTRSAATPAAQATVLSFALPPPYQSDGITPVDSSVITYELDGDAGQGSQVYIGGNFGKNPNPPQPKGATNAGFTISLGTGTRTATDFSNTVTLTPTGAQQTVNVQISWSDTMSNLSNAVSIMSQQTLLTSAQTYNFAISGLDATKTYYYQVTKNGDPNTVYSSGVQQIDPYKDPSKPATPTPTKTNASEDLSGNLVPCDGKTTNPCTFDKLIDLINKVIKFLLYLTVPIAAVVFSYAGVIFLTKGSNPSAREHAIGMFWNVFWGIIIALIAVLVIKTILDALGVGTAYRSFLL